MKGFTMSDLTFDSFCSLYSPELFPEIPGFDFDPALFFSPEVREKLWKISDILIDHGKQFNLTSILDPAEIVRKHLIDSLAPLGMILGEGIRPLMLLDVGTGGGFPLLPMAAVLCSEDYRARYGGGTRFTGLDATAKKISHIQQAAAHAGIPSVSAVNGRAEEMARGEMREKFDLVTARAVASLPVLAELCAPFVHPGGFFAALKSHAEDELPAGDRAAEKLGMTRTAIFSYEIPGGDLRTLILYRKISSCSPKYPRRYADITKHPLP